MLDDLGVGAPPAVWQDLSGLGKAAYRKKLNALSKAAYGAEDDLWRLVAIAALMDCDGISANRGARKIAAQEAANSPRARAAMHKNLYRKFQQAPAIYRRLAAAVGHGVHGPRQEATAALVEAAARELKALSEFYERLAKLGS